MLQVIRFSTVVHELEETEKQIVSSKKWKSLYLYRQLSELHNLREIYLICIILKQKNSIKFFQMQVHENI